ncbi:fructose PTS transporter subunit IIA [Clostridioides difficile]
MTDIINENLIKLDIKKNSKEEIIKELAQLINDEKRLNNYEEYVQDVLKRESLTTTGIGFGIAIPHGKSTAVEVPTVAVGRINEGVDWDSLDGNPVKIVFQLAVPEEADSDQHLKILAALSRKLMDEDFVSALFNSQDKEGLLNLLTSVFEKITV